jgi:hypothetical protein
MRKQISVAILGASCSEKGLPLCATFRRRYQESHTPGVGDSEVVDCKTTVVQAPELTNYRLYLPQTTNSKILRTTVRLPSTAGHTISYFNFRKHVLSVVHINVAEIGGCHLASPPCPTPTGTPLYYPNRFPTPMIRTFNFQLYEFRAST